MEIKLLEDLPIQAVYGCIKGEIYEVVRMEEGAQGRSDLYYFKSHKTGTECAAYRHECEIIK